MPRRRIRKSVSKPRRRSINSRRRSRSRRRSSRRRRSRSRMFASGRRIIRAPSVTTLVCAPGFDQRIMRSGKIICARSKGVEHPRGKFFYEG